MTAGAVVVGASIAGIRTAQSLRSSGYQQPITLIGQEASAPYDKPPLSKSLLAGTSSLDEHLLLTDDQARGWDIALNQGVAATGLDIVERVVSLADGTAVGYDELVIATGARARRPPWSEVGGVHVLRTAVDYLMLRFDLSRSRSVVIAGAGFVGSEVASTCRRLGLDVTIVDQLPVPLLGRLGLDLGSRMAQLHRQHGTRTLFGVGVEHVVGEQGALAVQLTDGSILECDTVVAAIGVEPNVGWLRESRIALDLGVVCDAYGRTSARFVYAAGDVARWEDPRAIERRRFGHWTDAVEQASVVAATLTAGGEPEWPAPTPTGYVWSDQYDWSLQIVGEPHRAVRSYTVQGSRQEPERFATLYTVDGETLCGAAVINSPRTALLLRKAVSKKGLLEDNLEAVEAMLGDGRHLAAVPD